MTITRCPLTNENTMEEIIEYVVPRVKSFSEYALYDAKGRVILYRLGKDSNLIGLHYFDSSYHRTKEAPHVHAAAKAIIFMVTGDVE